MRSLALGREGECTALETARHLSKWRAFLEAQMVKNLLAMQETGVQSLRQEDSLEEGMATHYRILAWRIPWTEEPGFAKNTL